MDALSNRLNTPIYNARCTVQARKIQNSEQVSNPSFGAKHDIFFIKWINDAVDLLVSKFPNDMTIKDDGFVKKAIDKCENFSSPQQRLFLGGTAILTQPWIDLFNKDTDEETRKISACRTAAKIVAGTATGFLIRWGCIKGIKELTKTTADSVTTIKSNRKSSIWSKVLIPDKTLITDGDLKKWVKLDEKQFEDAIRLIHTHRNALGTCIALGVMLVTNFALDVPITKFLTNVFVDKFVKPNPGTPEAKGGK